jgi:hypothetical protein
MSSVVLFQTMQSLECRMVRAVGIEPAQNSEVFIGKKGRHKSSGSLIGSPEEDFDEGLTQILQIWPELNKAQKDALLSLVRAFGKEEV